MVTLSNYPIEFIEATMTTNKVEYICLQCEIYEYIKNYKGKRYIAIMDMSVKYNLTERTVNDIYYKMNNRL